MAHGSESMAPRSQRRRRGATADARRSSNAAYRMPAELFTILPMTPDAPWLDRTQWPWQPRTCPTPDGLLHYVDEGQGPTMILVHGTPTWAFEWRHVIAGLRDVRRVVA